MKNVRQIVMVVTALVSLVRSGPLPSESDHSLPSTLKDYFKQRDTLLTDEKTFEHRAFNLNEDETVVNRFFQFLKWRDMENSRLTGFSISRQITEAVLEEIRASELYVHLLKLPKGGNLHSHENQQLSKKTLFDLLWSSPDFNNLYVMPPLNATYPPDAWSLDFFVNPPIGENWEKVASSNLTREDILMNSNYIGASSSVSLDPSTDSGKRWQFFNKLTDRAGSDVINNINVKKKYIPALYQESLDHGITYLETRRSYSASSLYELDFSGKSNATNGKKYLSGSNFSVEIKFVLGLLAEFQQIHPEFLGHKTIVTAVRSRTPEAFQSALNNAMQLHKDYPNHVAGFDSVGEEDAGYSTLHFVKNYLTDFSGGRASIPLFLHSVETNWPDDLMFSQAKDDLVATLENGYEAILLQPKRVGHGKGFLKTPYLRQIMKERKIAVEACLISNQILGYDPDMRNHFALTFHREGIPIVLAPDDPGSMGYDGVTVDWYAALIGWGLNVGDLKQIALNSLIYSAMNDEEQQNAISKWTPTWNDYITKIKNIACARDFAAEASIESRKVTFSQSLPDSGTPGTNVHVFGRNFEVAVCKTPKCKFGEISVDAVYLSYRHLMCKVPDCQDCNSNKVGLSVALDGVKFESFGSTFEYSQNVLNGVSRSYNKLFNVALIATVSLFSFDLI